MVRQKVRFFTHLLVGSLVAALCTTSVQAQQDSLTRAEVYKLLNQVQLLLKNKPPRAAKRADVLVPLDALQTKTRSKAELKFNEGSLARIGSSATFRFKPGLRRYELPGGGLRSQTILELRNGTALAMAGPGSTVTTVETPQFTVDNISGPPATPLPGTDIYPTSLRSGAVALYFDSEKNTGGVFNLTSLPVTVTSLDGKQVTLQAGQTVTVKDGVIGPVQNFDLRKFYQTSSLSLGLGPGQEAEVEKETPDVRSLLNAVRKETLAAVEAQRLWVEGLCSINGRYHSSTLATNCITTNSDDPLRTFEDRRDVVTPTNEVVEQLEPEIEPQTPPRQ